MFISRLGTQFILVKAKTLPIKLIQDNYYDFKNEWI